MDPLQLRDFHILLANGQHITDSIENIVRLEEIIRIYGTQFISKITFYFYDSRYKYHNLTLILCEGLNKFIVEFFHYYDENCVRIELSLDEKIRDYNTVIESIHGVDNLSILCGHIIKPF